MYFVHTEFTGRHYECKKLLEYAYELVIYMYALVYNNIHVYLLEQLVLVRVSLHYYYYLFAVLQCFNDKTLILRLPRSELSKSTLKKASQLWPDTTAS